MSLRGAKRRSNPINIKKYNAIGATHVALCDNIGFYFINWCRVFRYTPLAMTENLPFPKEGRQGWVLSRKGANVAMINLSQLLRNVKINLKQAQTQI